MQVLALEPLDHGDSISHGALGWPNAGDLGERLQLLRRHGGRRPRLHPRLRGPSEHEALLSLEELTEKGFRCEEPAQAEKEEGEAPAEDDDHSRLEFHRDDACDGDKPEEFVFEILDIVLPLDGDYDGWGSLLQTEEDSAE